MILGNKSALTGGSGKVVDSALDDHIFIYYSDHGSAGVVGKYNSLIQTHPCMYLSVFILFNLIFRKM